MFSPLARGKASWDGGVEYEEYLDLKVKSKLLFFFQYSPVLPSCQCRNPRVCDRNFSQFLHLLQVESQGKEASVISKLMSREPAKFKIHSLIALDLKSIVSSSKMNKRTQKGGCRKGFSVPDLLHNSLQRNKF